MRRQDREWEKTFQYVYLTRLVSRKRTITTQLQEDKQPSRKFDKLLEYWLHKIRYTKLPVCISLISWWWKRKISNHFGETVGLSTS